MIHGLKLDEPKRLPGCMPMLYMLLGLKINSRKFFIRLTQLRISTVLE